MLSGLIQLVSVPIGRAREIAIASGPASRKWTVDEQISILRTLQLTTHLKMELPR